MAKEVYCNMCGKKFDMWDVNEDFSLFRVLGYGTSYDGETLDLDICCGCMDRIIEKCKIPPVESLKKHRKNTGLI